MSLTPLANHNGSNIASTTHPTNNNYYTSSSMLSNNHPQPPANYKYFVSPQNQLLPTHTNNEMNNMDGSTRETSMFSNNRKLVSSPVSNVSVLPNLKEFLQETYSAYPAHNNQSSTPHVPIMQSPTQYQRRYSNDESIHSSSNNRKYETNSNASYPRTVASLDSPNGNAPSFFSSASSASNANSRNTLQYPHASEQNLSPLFERISKLEKQLERQSGIIYELERENDCLRVQITESEKRLNGHSVSNHYPTLHSNACVGDQQHPPNPEPIKTRAKSNIVKKRKESPTHDYHATSPVSNSSSYEKPTKSSKLNSKHTNVVSNNTFSIVDESDRDHTKSQKPVGDLDDFSVKWKGKTYVLIDAFKNRTQILNYFVPLFQNKYPEKNCKLVLCNEDYKTLFKENYNRQNSEKKHAWRVSIFTIEFYNFVKSQQVDN